VESGAQPRNQNAKKGAEWRQAIKRALTRVADSNDPDGEISYRKGLDIVADKFVAAASNGDPWAMKELGDRIDGKPKQSIEADINANIETRLIING